MNSGIILVLLAILCYILIYILNYEWYNRDHYDVINNPWFSILIYAINLLFCLYIKCHLVYSLPLTFILYPLFYAISILRQKILYKQILKLAKTSNFNCVYISSISFNKDKIIVYYVLASNSIFQFNIPTIKEYQNYFPNKRSYFTIIKSIKMNIDDASLILNQMKK